jgi:lysophospholipase L1-like esterase
MESSSTHRLHYVALGDSITAEPGKTSTFVSRLSDRLKEEQPLEAHNYGIPGATVSSLKDQIARNSRLQDELQQADFITITIGGNDLLASYHALARNPDCRSEQQHLHCLQAIPTTFQSSWDKLIEEIQKYTAPESKVVIAAIYHPILPDNLAAATTVNSSEITRILTQINQLISTSAASNGFLVADLPSLFNQSGQGQAQSSLISADGIHPNQQGHQTIADSIYSLWHEPSPSISSPH